MIDPGGSQAPPTARKKKPLWRRLVTLFLWLAGCGFVLTALFVLTVWWLWSSGRLLTWLVQREAEATEQRAPTERPWPPAGTPTGVVPADSWAGPREALGTGLGPAGFYRMTNIWDLELRFSRKGWERVQIRPVPHLFKLGPIPEKMPLRNPAAPRNGLAGVMGIRQPWSEATVVVGGVEREGVSVRFKGNGTFLGAIATHKKPYKVDFLRGNGGAPLAGLGELNLNNLNTDFSGVNDALAYWMYREAGVPAPRTAYGRLRLTIEGRFEKRPLGLYVLVEPIDEAWLKGFLPGRKAALFKPVTYELFADLGRDWSRYESVYDPKTRLEEGHRQRVMQAAGFVTLASEEEFARRVGEFFDLEAMARFVAVTSMISSYDGFLSNGQNFLMYLDGPQGRFGMIPWDLDHAWGAFPLAGTREERERASVRHPWVSDHRLLERLFRVPAFEDLYLRTYAELHGRLFDVARLGGRVRELGGIIRPVVLEESDYRIERFDQSHAEVWPEWEPEGLVSDPFRPVHRIHRFLEKRSESIRRQLGGEETGHVFRQRRWMQEGGG